MKAARVLFLIGFILSIGNCSLPPREGIYIGTPSPSPSPQPIGVSTILSISLPEYPTAEREIEVRFTMAESADHSTVADHYVIYANGIQTMWMAGGREIIGYQEIWTSPTTVIVLPIYGNTYKEIVQCANSGLNSVVVRAIGFGGPTDSAPVDFIVP